MHLPDGFLTPRDALITYTVAVAALIWASRKTRQTSSKTLVPAIATAAAFIFAAQALNFPIAFGISAHLVGSVLLCLLLGPYAGMTAMAVVLLVQAVLLGDGGLTTYGANVLNIAVLGSLPYYLVRVLNRKPGPRVRLIALIFMASWLSVVLGATAAGVEIGFSPVFMDAGGVAATLPAMLAWHLIVGIVEGAITAVAVSYLWRSAPQVLRGLAFSVGGN